MAARSGPQEIRARLERARLYCLVGGRGVLAQARQALAGGAQAIQLREKEAGDRELLALARELAERCRQAGALFIVNDRPDVARLAGADGVHLGQSDLPVAAARAITKPGALVGVSTHTDREVEAALADGADYLGLGACWPTPTKPGAEAGGLELVRRWAARLELPWFAIGGITLERLDELRALGVRRIAVSSAVCGVPDPEAAARAFLERLA